MQNKTMLQGFEWNISSDALHYQRLIEKSDEFENLGINMVWMPPAYKGSGGIYDVGYGVYDTYDLGEFDQKGTIPTKYGSKEDLLKLIEVFHKHDIAVIADIVLNHRLGADEKEWVDAFKTNQNNRDEVIEDARKILAWTKFTFPNRKGKYSDFVWSWRHFDGTDWDDDYKYKGLFRFVGKEWEQNTDDEYGNYDYLMGADLDLSNLEVIEELDRWGSWFTQTLSVDGFRLDAIKHMDFKFYTHWLNRLRQENSRDFFAVGEYWNGDCGKLLHYQEVSQHCMHLFDVPLHYRFLEAATSNGQFDLTKLFEGTFVQHSPSEAVTFVDNHDTQPNQALTSFIPSWFKPMAYACILLREEGIPCVFYGDLEGLSQDQIPPVKTLPYLLLARKYLAYGKQEDYFDDANCIGWVRLGDAEHPHSGLVVLFSDQVGGAKRMFVGLQHVGKTFYDLTFTQSEVLIDDEGFGNFNIPAGQLGVWCSESGFHHCTIEK